MPAREKSHLDETNQCGYRTEVIFWTMVPVLCFAEETTVTNATKRSAARWNFKSIKVLALIACCFITGCGADSFMDPSRTGRFEGYPTTTPVLERIDIIEPKQEFWANAEPPQPTDLLPRELLYFIYPGDIVTLAIYELHQLNSWATLTRRVDAGGYFRVPEVGDIRAAGLTAQQFQDEVKRVLAERVMENPQVDVSVEQSGGLRYTVYGFVQNPGVFTLENPNLRLVDALAIAGGAPFSTDRIYVIRQVVLSDEVRPSFEQSSTPGGVPATRPQVDVESLIEQLDQPNRNGSRNDPNIRPGMLQDVPPSGGDDAPPSTSPAEPLVDIDELESTPPRPPAPSESTQLEPVRPTQQPPVDVDAVRPPQPQSDRSGDSFIYVEERGEWVRVPSTRPSGNQSPEATGMTDEPNLTLNRIIEIDYQLLARGDTSLNIVVRPNDSIYIESPEQGLVYIDGEISRPGVYSLPTMGRLTLSRLISTAGGFAPIAIPEKVDLIRVIGKNREAKIRMNVAAIRQGTEPDIYMKPDDHIIVGTNFWATPLAIIRSGFRATYGFGFILDRNFGNDVFGAPPEDNGF
jgi:polysaccharide biosynthesis/export protein